MTDFLTLMGVSSNFIPPTGGGGGYLHYYTLTIDHTQCGSSDTSNYTALVYLSDSSLKTVANGGSIQHTVTFNGYTVPADLVFSSDSGATSPYSFELAYYDGVNGILEAYVKLPTLSHSTNTVFYLNYGNASVSTYQGGSVGDAWRSDYVGVYHFRDGTTLDGIDSTANANNLTNQTASAVAGKIDGGEQQSTSSNYLNIASTANLSPATITVSCWINPNSFPVDDGYITLFGKDNGSTYDYSFLLKTNGKLAWYVHSTISSDVFQDGGGAAVSLSTWTYVTGTYTANSVTKTRINGAADATGSGDAGSVFSSTLPFYVGHSGFGFGQNRHYDGIQDEIRIMSIVISADEDLSNYNNQNNPGNFGSPGFYTVT